MSITNDQRGFTIIELLISTAVFSVILLIFTFGILQITRTYVQGAIQSETQNTLRSIVNQMSQAAELSSSADPASISSEAGYIYSFCLNSQEYTYQLYTENTDAFLSGNDTSGDCSTTLTEGASGVSSLLSPYMRLIPTFSNGHPYHIVNYDSSDNLYTIAVTILYGDSDTWTQNANGTYSCNPLDQGGAYCAIATTTTTVQPRL